MTRGWCSHPVIPEEGGGREARGAPSVGSTLAWPSDNPWASKDQINR